MNKKGFAAIAIVLVLAGLVIIGGGAWYYVGQRQSDVKTPGEVASSTAITIDSSIKSTSDQSGIKPTSTSAIVDMKGSVQTESEKELQDFNRAQDLNLLNSAISLYLATGQELSGCGEGKEYRSNTGSRVIDGTGWLPVNFSKIPGRPVFEKLPVDPVNDAVSYYSYACNSATSQYELNVRFQSQLHSKNGTKDAASKDNGNNSNLYEVGTNLELLK